MHTAIKVVLFFSSQCTYFVFHLLVYASHSLFLLFNFAEHSIHLVIEFLLRSEEALELRSEILKVVSQLDQLVEAFFHDVREIKQTQSVSRRRSIKDDHIVLHVFHRSN